MSKNSAKSLTKTAVLDASDNPDDQDEARKRRVKMDFASWRKQTKAGKTTHQEEVGISSSAEMKKAKKEAELQKKEAEAVKKVKKEEIEVQERTLDTFEKGEKERIVKGMKKDTKDLKKRYGKKWKNVMYATATKKAKEEGDTSKSDKRYAYESANPRDKAFANVVARLQAKHGKDAVITKDNPMKPPTEAQKKEYAAHKAKIAAQDTRDDIEKSSQGRYSRKYSNRGSD